MVQLVSPAAPLRRLGPISARLIKEGGTGANRMPPQMAAGVDFEQERRARSKRDLDQLFFRPSGSGNNRFLRQSLLPRFGGLPSASRPQHHQWRAAAGQSGGQKTALNQARLERGTGIFFSKPG